MTYTLDIQLTQEQAEALLALLRNVAGGDDTGNKYCQQVANELERLRVEERDDYEFSVNNYGGTPAIVFEN